MTRRSTRISPVETGLLGCAVLVPLLLAGPWIYHLLTPPLSPMVQCLMLGNTVLTTEDYPRRYLVAKSFHIASADSGSLLAIAPQGDALCAYTEEPQQSHFCIVPWCAERLLDEDNVDRVAICDDDLVARAGLREDDTRCQRRTVRR